MIDTVGTMYFSLYTPVSSARGHARERGWGLDCTQHRTQIKL